MENTKLSQRKGKLTLFYCNKKKSKILKGQTDIVQTEGRRNYGQQNGRDDNNTIKSIAGVAQTFKKVEIWCSGRVSNSCTTSVIRRVTKQPKQVFIYNRCLSQPVQERIRSYDIFICEKDILYRSNYESDQNISGVMT